MDNDSLSEKHSPDSSESSTGTEIYSGVNNRKFGWLLFTATFAVSIIVAGIGVYGIIISREFAAQNATIQSQNLAHFINQSISATFNRIDHSLFTAVHELESELARGGIDRPRMRNVLAFEEKLLPEAIAIRVSNSEGRVIFGNASGDSSASYADQPYFPYLRDHPDAHLYVTQPISGIFTEKWLISSARRYNLPDGRFGGVVVAPVLLEHFQKALSGYDVGRGGMLTLRYIDGGFVARHPTVVKDKILPVGDRTFSPELKGIIASGVSEKTYMAAAPFDKTKRVLTFRRIEGAPFFVVASLAQEDYLTQWHKDEVWMLAIIAVFLAGLWIMCLLVGHSGKRRGRAEEARRESEARFRSVFENSAVGKSITYMDGSMNANPAFYKMLGYTKDELSLQKWQSVTHPDDVAESQRHIDLLRSGKKHAVRFTKRYLKKDGTVVWADVNVVLQKDTEGKPLYYITGMVDITDRKRAEEAVVIEKERLLVTLRSIGDAVIATDVGGNVVLMNRVAEDLTGWPLAEAAGKTLAEVFNVINELTRRPIDGPVEKVLSSGEIIELADHTLLISRDGRERMIADSGAPIKDRENNLIGVVLVFRDTTEKQKFLEAAQTNQKLESLGVLAGGIAHDFNNLLGGIFGYIDLAQGEADHTTASSYLSKAMTAIERARALTGQLLTFAKGGAPIRKVGRLFPFVRETARFALSGSNVSCSIDAPEDLRACSFDRNQIGQVIDNIVINALQAMPSGGSIELSARNVSLSEKQLPALPPGDYVKISIRDHGIGMSKELLPRIFDPFFTTKAKGHGLGLATCYSIVNRHGGSIGVESEPGKGSTFHVYLPAYPEPVPADSETTAPRHTGSGVFLIMDDEEVMRETICRMLASFGYTVVCTENGAAAVEFITREMKAGRTVAGMIFDLTVAGGMGGKDAVSEIRKMRGGAEIPVFVASGYADDPVMKNPAAFGFTASICKPFRKNDLSEMLNGHLPARN